MSDLAIDKALAAPVDQLVLVDEMERSPTGPFQSQSVPGHLVHIVTAGSVSQWAEGRAETLGRLWFRAFKCLKEGRGLPCVPIAVRLSKPNHVRFVLVPR